MKLLELLVRELPKRGGWPYGAAKAVSYDFIPGVHFWDGDGFGVDYSDLTTRALEQEEVTREQYEAAMQQPVWNGEGLPPVGVECEFSFSGEPYRKCEILFLSKYTLVIKDCSLNGDDEESYCPEDVKFRPIQSEADKKREHAVEALSQVVEYRHGCGYKPMSGWIYDAIAAGKIPGIKLE